MSQVHMQTFPAFQQREQQPLGFLLWPSPSWPHLPPHHLLTVPEKPWCFHWSELSPQAASGLGHRLVCPEAQGWDLPLRVLLSMLDVSEAAPGREEGHCGCVYTELAAFSC